ncbi:MAG: NRDE family protein [Saprospiraceae bacterium]|nr:NRDE family protein [Saprospiraceae bacterium]
MCTVTYLPRPRGFVLTHNRDEAPSRSPQSIVRERTPGGQTLLFPRDTQAGGTWIASSRNGKTACLLNGAFILHRRQLPYRKSRGLILLDFFDWESSDAFFADYDLHNIEPFTFLAFERTGGNHTTPDRILEFRWDGEQRHLKHLDPCQPHFWCSATLYPAEMQRKREAVFQHWLGRLTTNEHKLPSAVLNLHQTGGVGDIENDFVMNRAGRVQTVSITQISVHEKNLRMKYLDLLGKNQSERRLITV